MPGGPPTAPIGTPPPSPGTDGGPGRSRVFVIVAVVAVIFLLAGAVAYVVSDPGDDAIAGDDPGQDDPGQDGGAEDDSGSSTTEVETPSTTVAPVSEEEFLALVGELSDYVAAARGLEFRSEVAVELADDEEFEARLLKDFEEDRDEIEKSEVFYRALGLLAPDADLIQELRAIFSAGVLGFYDPESNELVVRGTTPTPYVQQTIVHELVHALDDQHFELFREEYDERPDEIGIGFATIVEGNARRIEDQWLGEQPAEVREAAKAEETAFGDDIDIDAFPEILLFEIGAPYELGLNLVGELVRDGGERAVDTALDDPPTTTEQVLDFQRYASREPRLEVPAPPVDGTLVDEGVVGALFLFGLLTTGDSTVSPMVAGEAIRGWGGDWAVTWEDGDADCVRMDLVGDTQTDTDQVEEALRAWAEGGPAAVSVVAGRVRVESCVLSVPGGTPNV